MIKRITSALKYCTVRKLIKYIGCYVLLCKEKSNPLAKLNKISILYKENNTYITGIATSPGAWINNLMDCNLKNRNKIEAPFSVCK